MTLLKVADTIPEVRTFPCFRDHDIDLLKPIYKPLYIVLHFAIVVYNASLENGSIVHIARRIYVITARQWTLTMPATCLSYSRASWT